MIRIRRLSVQKPLDAQPSLGTRPSYEAAGDLRFKVEKKCSD